MTKSRPKTFDAVLRALSDTLHALKDIHRQGDKAASDARLGSIVGLSRDQVVKIKNFATVAPLKSAWLIACEGSRFDIDLIGNLFAFGPKRLMRPPEGLPGPNGSTAEEDRALHLCAGMFHDRLCRGDFEGAKHFAQGIVATGWAFIHEAEEIERAGLAMGDVRSPLPSGDGLPGQSLAAASDGRYSAAITIKSQRPCL